MADKKDVVEALFLGMINSAEFIADKDTANKLEERFSEQNLEEFFGDLYLDVKETMEEELTEEELFNEVAKLGVLTMEYIKFKIKNNG